MIRLQLLPVLLLAALGLSGLTDGLLAQPPQTTKTLDIPISNPIPRTDAIPLGEDQIHYQQWYDGTQFAQTIKQPVRIVGVEFLGAAASGVTYDIEITLANASANLSGTFSQNYVSNTVVVLKRAKVTPTGATVRFNFTTDWVYDGKSNVVVDLKIFANALNQRFTHPGVSTISKISNTKRQFYIGNANATVANSQGATGHYGLITRFLYQEGGNYTYGQGCPGGVNIVPVASANAVPMPGLATYTQILEKAGAGYPAIFVLGISDKTIGGANLPIGLDFLGARNCLLYSSADFIAFTKTVGGGPGTGSAKLPTPVPPIGNLGGVKVYSQWLILDSAATNGNLSAAAPLMHVVGS